MCTRMLICSTVFAPPTKVEQIRTRVLICTRVHFHKTSFTWPKYTPGANLHHGFSLTSGKVPLIWNVANVTPIFKKDDPSVVSNHRPISLLSTVGKVLEKIVHKHLFNFIRDNNILTTLQSGFVPGDSTVNQLVDIYNTFCHSLDQGKEVRAVFCDLSKAFDRVWHRGLLYKLESAGISGSLLLWFKDYLNDRKQRVVLPGSASSWAFIKAGVPQGSILCPLLLLIYKRYCRWNTFLHKAFRWRY